MSLSTVGSFTLGEVNLAATTAIGFLNPLLVQLDLSLFGAFGLGALQGDLSAQFNAALEVQVDIGLEISNPLAAFQAALQGILQIQAGLQAAISLGLPVVSAELNVGLSAQAAVTAALGAKLGGISALIEAALSVKISATSFVADLAASLGLGPVFLLSFQNDALATSGANIQAAFAAGLIDGGNTIAAGETCYGVVIVTKAPSAWAAIQATLKAA